MEITRDNLREEIERVYQTSLVRKYWGMIGRALARLVGRKGEIPAWISYTVALVLVQVIATLLGIALREQTAISAVSFRFSYPMLAYVWLCMVVFQALVNRIIRYFKSELVNALDLPASQTFILGWLHMAGQVSLQVVLIFIFVLGMTTLSVFVIFTQGGIPVSTTIYVFLALVLLQIAPHLYWIFMIAFTFAFSIRQWKFNLFPDDPSRTPVIQTMHQVSSNVLLTVALVLALNFILIIPLRLYSQYYLIAIVTLFWVPALLYFLSSESAFYACWSMPSSNGCPSSRGRSWILKIIRTSAKKSHQKRSHAC